MTQKKQRPPVIVLHPSIAQGAARELKRAGFIVVIAHEPSMVQIIETQPAALSGDVLLACAARALSEATYGYDKFGKHVAKAIIERADKAASSPGESAE